MPRRSPPPHSRWARPRSSFATRAVTCLGCAGAIFSVLLLQFFVLPATHKTAQVPPISASPGLCQGDSAGNSSLCGDQGSSAKKEVDAAEEKGPVLVVKPQAPKSRASSASHLTDPGSVEWPNTVALCAMMKAEHTEDVLEWLDYHRWIGVDKVFLRENGEEISEELLAATKQHTDSGFLDLNTWPGEKHPSQNRWHNRCSQFDLAGAFSWIAYIDLDEFMILMEKGEAAEEPELKEFLLKNRNAAGLSLQWLLFGSSGHKRRPEPGGPLRHYSTCTGELAYQMKCMASTFHLCDTPMLGDTVHDCAYKYDGTGGRGDLDTAHPVILGDGDPVATHLTTVEAAIRAAAAEKAAIAKGKTPMKIGPKKTPPPHPSDPTTPDPPTTTPPDDSSTIEDIDTHSSATADAGPVKGAGGGGPIGWRFSDVLTGGGGLQHSARSLLGGGLIGDILSSIPDVRMGETVCRSYNGHLNERQHTRHRTVPEEQMLVLAHYVTRSFDDYVSRKLSRPSGIYAHSFKRLSRSKSPDQLTNETIFDEFEEQQRFNGLDSVCSSIVRNNYAERCCSGASGEAKSDDGLQATAAQTVTSIANLEAGDQ